MFFIYRLTDEEQDYYGQTENPKERLKCHKSKSEKTRSTLLDKSKLKMHIIHRLYTKQEADETEAFYQLNFPCVNHNIAGKLPKEYLTEYYQEHKTERLEYQSNYYQENKEEINKKQQEHYNKNKEKILKRQTKYRQEHREQLKERGNNYYQKNKDKINAKNSAPYECECGSVVRKDSKSTHIKSKKHRDYINQK